jgi:hypothetical protein
MVEKRIEGLLVEASPSERAEELLRRNGGGAGGERRALARSRP